MANTKKITIEISPNLHKKAKRKAKKEKISLSEFVRQALYAKVK